jgi:hypothetical protein
MELQGWEMRHLIPFLGALVVLTACSSADEQPLPTDKVRDSVAAIDVARKICRATDTSASLWTAEFVDGEWKAKLVFPGGDSSCNWEKASVRAADGMADGCETCVAAE